VVSSIAVEPGSENASKPGSESAWLALDSPTDAEQPSALAPALLARISANGTIADEQSLPSPQEVAEGVGPRGAADKIACPAPHDCWMATTQGWLFHLAPADERQLPEDSDPAFASLIAYRPPDEGLPQAILDAPPPDDSGLPGEASSLPIPLPEPPTAPVQSKTTLPLLSHMHTRLLHGSTLELRFHLAVKARVRLLAKRHRQVVASTPMRTLAAGARRLLLRLSRRRWPTKLDLQTHALARLPTVSTSGGGARENTVSTGLIALPRTPSFTGLEALF
jgi:hypothetical protein